MPDVRGDLSGLPDLEDWLAEIRKVAALEGQAALDATDVLLWSVLEKAQAPDDASWLAQEAERDRESRKQEIARLRASLTQPALLRPFDGELLRREADRMEDSAERTEMLALSADLLEAYALQQIEQARAQLVTPAGVPKLVRQLDNSVEQLRQADRLTEKVKAETQEVKRRLASLRADRKREEAEVAEAGGNPKKALKLRAEAAVMLQQDLARLLPGESNGA
jgi:hypothetical protein